jgi:ATP-binding cassette subfamily B protein
MGKGDFFSKSNNISTYELIFRLWKLLSKRRKKQYFLLMILMLISTFAEILSLGSVIPFLGILLTPETVFESPYLAFFINFFNFESANELVFPLTLMFIVLSVLAGGFRLSFLWISTRIAFNSGLDISHEIYNRTLHQPYLVHVSRNSSEVVSGIVNKVNGVVFWTIIPVVTLVSTTILLISIVSILIIINPIVALIAIAGFGGSYGAITFFSKKRLLLNGISNNREQNQVIKILQEGLGGIRNVLIDGLQSYYSNIYYKADQKLRKGLANNNILGGFPRPAMESLGMVLIAMIAYMVYQTNGGIAESIPLLGALALSAQRLLPALQQGYSAWANIIGGKASLENTVELLEQPISEEYLREKTNPLPLNKSIKMRNVRFKYSNDEPFVLDDFSMTISKGQRIGIVGSTGSGKSTVLDILMGLIIPTSGVFSIDKTDIDKSNVLDWQSNISHVPQSIYLADRSFSENIAYGVSPENIDMKRIKNAAAKSHIDSFIENTLDGYNTVIGEHGVKLSGGQRQRLGIARALYKKADVLILDEATSALDNLTETSVMESIEQLDRDLTVIIVAHRLSTIKHCDSIIEINNGKVVGSGTYDELMNVSPSFHAMVKSMDSASNREVLEQERINPKNV